MNNKIELNYEIEKKETCKAQVGTFMPTSNTDRPQATAAEVRGSDTDCEFSSVTGRARTN